MQNSLFLIAKISPKPEFYDIAAQAIVDVVTATLEEPGCRQFSVHKSLDNQSLYLYEEWDNQAALDHHYTMPYIKPVFESYQEWLAKPVEISKLSKLA